MKTERRDFLKIATAGATSAVLGRGGHAFAAWPGSGTMEINPAISNLRVVALVDPAMIPTTPSTMTLATQSSALDAARVGANLDAMAMALSQKCTPDEAWRTIFRSSRPWSSTVVAIKINTAESRNMARVAVVDKVCRVLNGFGVPAANIFLYDAHGSANSYSSYCSKTDTSKIPAVVDTGGMGGATDVPLPDGTTAPCAKKIADGTVDILINLPTNKGHSAFGGATLSCKNHFGTFAPNHFCPPSDAGNFCSNPDTTKFYNYVFTINKSDAIIGGNPARQQLCIVDSLFANKVENTGTPEAMPCYLVMGTFGPAVDYLTIKKIREEVMGAKHTASLVSQYMTQFGYTTNDPQWLLVPPAGVADAGTCTSSGEGTGGTGGEGTGGTKGTGGAAAGGAKGTGGAGSGGTPVAGAPGGRVGAGGGKGTGGAGAGGSGGTTTASGGTKASGGASSGGTTMAGASGGSGGSGGAGGALASSTASASGGSGGAVGSGGAGGTAATGGTTSSPTSNGTSGCNCRVGGSRASGLTVGAALAVLAAGQLRRLCLRRDATAKADAGEGEDRS